MLNNLIATPDELMDLIGIEHHPVNSQERFFAQKKIQTCMTSIRHGTKKREPLNVQAIPRRITDPTIKGLQGNEKVYKVVSEVNTTAAENQYIMKSLQKHIINKGRDHYKPTSIAYARQAPDDAKQLYLDGQAAIFDAISLKETDSDA